MAKLIESTSDVVDVLEQFSQYWENWKGVEDIVKQVEYAREPYIGVAESSVKPDDQGWLKIFMVIGRNAMLEMDNKGIQLTDLGRGCPDAQSSFAKFLIQKNTNYGDTPIRRWGEIGVLIRIDSKLQRYIHLIQNPQADIGDEPLKDTIRDIVGYCVLGVRLVMEKKKESK